MAIVITIAIIISIMLLVAGLSLPFVNSVSATNHLVLLQIQIIM
jgi:hypothetical protein